MVESMPVLFSCMVVTRGHGKIRVPANLKSKFMIAYPGDQIEPQPKPFATIPISVSNNFKSFYKANDVLNNNSFT